jgi:hypothetical protein
MYRAFHKLELFLGVKREWVLLGWAQQVNLVSVMGQSRLLLPLTYDGGNGSIFRNMI